MLHHRRSLFRLLPAALALALALGALGAVSGRQATAAQTFPMPKAAGWTIWPAERADREGAWEVGGPNGAGERYLQPAASTVGNPAAAGAALIFPFETDRPATLRVRPVWWPTGEQKLAKRFPYPLVRQPGPDALDYVGATLFASAPAAGRVIAIDAATEKPIGAIEVGGYVADIVADRENGRVYIADALGDRVVAIDANARTVLGAMNVPGTPWSLALHGGVLYVACRDGRRLVGFDTTDGKTVCDVALPAEPISVEVTGNPPAGLVVRFQQQPFDVFTLEPAPADAQQFASTPSNGAPPPGCGGPDCDCSWPEVAGPHQLADVGFKKAREVLDVSKVTRGTAPLDIVSRFGDHPGPAAAVQYGFGEPKVYYTWFLSPSLGRLGVLAYKARALDSFELGGYLSGMALVNDKLYITDAAGDRVIVFDPKTRKVESEISVPGQPWSLAVVGNVNPQRSDPWPPKLVNRLYVICRESTDLAAVDLASKQVANRVPLTAEARGVKFVAMPNPDWWPVMADERIPLVLQPRVAVEYRPVVLDLATLQPKPAPMETAEAAPTRKAASSASKSFSATNELVVGVDGKRWVDISALADPQLLPDRPLATKDTAGSITVSVDGGPEMNWAAATWMAPDSEMFLVNEGEEFWRYNAPALEVRPGRHALRVRANSPFARLEAVAVRRSPEPQLDATLLPEPQEVHAKVPLISYQGVFYDQEPARFTLRVTNGGAALTARLSWTLHNYMGEVVQTSTGALMLAAGETLDHVIAPTTKDTGRFTLTAVIDTPDGQVTRQARFLKLPKLEHPRMFWRKEEAAAIQARIAQHPNLFRRYADWLERMSQKEGRLPERFLPAGMTAKELEAVAPEGMPDWDKHEACAWRMYELGWRMLAAEFATIFLKPDSEKLRTKVEALRNAEKTDGYVQYHHHGPFFPGAAASLVDLAPDGQRANLKLYQQMAAAAGDVNTLPWTLVTLEDPLTPEKRALIYKIMTLENNAEQYFETHRGTRGGLWWSDPYTGCYCPIAGYMLTFMYLHNIFGEPRMFEKPLFSGYLTFQRYADPYRDIQELQPGRRGPNGEPWRWILSTLSRHPLEKSNYQWEEWIAKMDGPMAGDEQAQVDRLMALDKMALTGPLRGGVNYFTSGVAVPVALALGWYEPEAPQVTWQEIPTTAVFDMEGWAMMRSGWEAKATEVTFASGVRDHTTRHKPNHFTVIKAGSYLIGTPALLWDDGNMVAAWANSVVVNDAWPEQWALNLTQPRDGEHLVINRFSPATFTYIGRNQKMFGYKPAEQGWGGGLDLHGHTHTLFMREGRLLAYQTWPQLDYVAGDASNAWPADQVSQIDRQLVFLKPDFIVIYDRVKLGPAGRKTAWVATTAPTLTASGDTFVVKGGSEYLTGRVLLPKRAVIATPQPMDLGWVWKDQKLLQIAPAEQSDQVEYLVVMRAGGGDAPLPAMQLIQDDRAAGVRLSLGGRAIELRFDRTGPVGGEAAVSENGKSDRYQLREAIVDSYANWASDPRFRKWTTESRFGFVIPQGDRR